MSFPVFCARVRLALCAAGVVLLVVSGFVVSGWLFWPGLGVLAMGVALYVRLGTVRREPIDIAPPVTGRWVPVNSPATRVPSHGIHAYGQTYAIDLVCEPADGSRPGFGWWPPARRPEAFPGFGQPVLAPAQGRVVRAHGRERDHWSRNSVLGIGYLIAASAVRELLGPSRILGNHVVLELDDGIYAVLAHLQRRSLRVRPGEWVAAGQQLGTCGNSGNSTEPHLHFQLQDRANVLIAAGLPMRFTELDSNRQDRTGLPSNGQPFITGADHLGERPDSESNSSPPVGSPRHC